MTGSLSGHRRLQAVAGADHVVRREREGVEVGPAALLSLHTPLVIATVLIAVQEPDLADLLFRRLLGEPWIGGEVRQVIKIGAAVMGGDEAADVRLRLGHHAAEELAIVVEEQPGRSMQGDEELDGDRAGVRLALLSELLLCALDISGVPSRMSRTTVRAKTRGRWVACPTRAAKRASINLAGASSFLWTIAMSTAAATRLASAHSLRRSGARLTGGAPLGLRLRLQGGAVLSELPAVG